MIHIRNINSNAMARPRRTRRAKAVVRVNKRRRSSRSAEEQGGLAPSPEPEDPPIIEDQGHDRGDNDLVPGLPHSDLGRFGRVRKPKVAVAARPGLCRGFHIARIIPYSSKIGGNEDQPYGPGEQDDDDKFQYRIGDFVLVLSPESTLRVTVRNYEGRQTKFPRRMLQTLYRPWSIPANIRLDDNGIPFPLKFMRDSKSVAEGDGTKFYRREAVMVMRESAENNLFDEVVDFERKAGSIPKTDLRTLYNVPWNLRVDAQEFADRWDLRGAPRPRRSDRVLHAGEESLEGEEASDSGDYDTDE